MKTQDDWKTKLNSSWKSPQQTVHLKRFSIQYICRLHLYFISELEIIIIYLFIEYKGRDYINDKSKPKLPFC